MPGKAAPAPVIAAPSWTGCYVGGHAGAGWANTGDRTWTDHNIPAPGIINFNPVTFSSSPQPSAVGGAQAGCNWQATPTWVFGVEGDFSLTSAARTSTNGIVAGTIGVPPGPQINTAAVVSMGERVDWLGSARGRVGYIWNENLFYMTGGVAWEHLYDSGAFIPQNNAVSLFFNSGRTVTGWVAGAGVEHMLSFGLVARLEYLYYGFSSGTTSTLANNPLLAAQHPSQTFTFGDNNVQVVRAGLSYKFN